MRLMHSHSFARNSRAQREPAAEIRLEFQTLDVLSHKMLSDLPSEDQRHVASIVAAAFESIVQFLRSRR